MKQVAGTLRLDLAQFRELAAFAQFGSDLDAATKAQIDRGQRMTEVLKQPQYTPYPVEEQVMVIFAAVNGFLDDLEVDEVVPFEHGLVNYLRTTYADLGRDIVAKKKLEESTEEALKQAIAEYKERFKAARNSNTVAG